MINVRDKLLMKDDKEVVINERQEEVERYWKQKQKIVLNDNVAATEKVQDNNEQEGKDYISEATRMRVQKSRVEDNQ